MTSKKAFFLVIGLVVFAFIEGLVKHFCPGFPIIEVLGFQATISGAILATKTLNDTAEMKYGIAPKAGTTTTFTPGGTVATSETAATPGGGE